MAEFIPGIIGSILGKVTNNLSMTLADAWNLKAKCNEFEMQLLTVRSLLEDSENKCWRKQSVKQIIKKVQAVIDKAEDVAEDFVYNAQYAEAQHDMSWSQKALMSVNQSKPCLGSIILKRKVNNAIKELKELVNNLRNIGLTENLVPPQTAFTQTTSEDDFMEIVGRQDATNSIIELLLAQEDQRKTQVVPIVGIGGLGKTTLAQLVYNDLRVDRHFSVKAWCYFGDRNDIGSVLKSVFESITDGKWNGGDDLQHLKKGLSEAISHRRMLLVLDDYTGSDSQFDDRMKSALCSSWGPGSCILLTSRSIPVTSEFITLPPYHLTSLSEDDAWEMFSRRAFSNGQERPEFVALGQDIVKMCKGLPLAVKVMSGLMRSKTTLADWESVTEGEIKDNSRFTEGVLDILLLSYNQLSCEEKQCFVLTSLFPKGSEIDCEKLIQLWAANSYLGEDQGNDVYKKGSLVLSSFIAKGFLQDMKMTRIQSEFFVLTVRMHDFLHDLAKTITNVCATSKDLLANKISVQDVRHLLIDISALKNEKIGSLLKDMKSIRTSIVTTDMNTYRYYLNEMGSHCKQLRLRSLRALQCAYVPHIHRHLICSLHLRYLDMSYLPLVTIPDSVCRLYSLQTLRVFYCKYLVCLPEDLANLKHLRHIHNLFCLQLRLMPPNLSRLTNLQTMQVFVADDENGRGIEELEHLNKLSNRLELWNLDRVESSARAMKANIVKKTQVTSLVLRWREDETVTVQPKDDDEKIFKARESVANNHCDVMMALEPHKHLSYLYVFDYGGPTLARWTRAPCHFQCLKKLSVVRCHWLDQIPAVWFSSILEELVLIGIYCLSTLSFAVGKGDSNTTLSIFPGLKRMVLSVLPRFENWVGNPAGKFNGLIILPKLEVLTLRHCYRVVNIPQCPVLKKIVVNTCSQLDLSKMHHLSLLQEIAYEYAARPIIHMHIDSWPALRTLELHGLLMMKLLPPQSHLSHQRDPRLPLPRSDHELISKSGQCCEHEIVPKSRIKSQQKPELDNMEIVENCFNNLEHLSLAHNCFTGLLSLPEEILQLWTCFSHVKSLKITSKDIVAWPTEICLLTSLKKLHVAYCTQLTGMDSNSDGVLPPTLLELIIERCHNLVKLPHLPSSLELLAIENCSRVECFSDDVTFPSLQKLQISGCPRLQALFVSGEKYHDSVSHVPRKEIEAVIRKTKWFTKNCSSIKSCLVV